MYKPLARREIDDLYPRVGEPGKALELLPSPECHALPVEGGQVSSSGGTMQVGLRPALEEA